jgi:hypothetical protein
MKNVAYSQATTGQNTTRPDTTTATFTLVSWTSISNSLQFQHLKMCRLIKFKWQHCISTSVSSNYRYLEQICSDPAISHSIYSHVVIKITDLDITYFQLDSSFLDCTKDSLSLPDELLHSIKDVLRQNYEDIDPEPIVTVS